MVPLFQSKENYTLSLSFVTITNLRRLGCMGYVGYTANTYTVQFWWEDTDYLEDPGRR